MESARMQGIKKFVLQAYVLTSWTSCASLIPNVFQPNVAVSAPVGGSVVLECYTTANSVVNWVWLKQIPGEKLNPIVSTYYKDIRRQEELLNGSQLEFIFDAKKSSLIFTKITSSDAAYYHCGVLFFEKLYFGGGCYLTVNEAKPVKVIQPPTLDHHIGDSVTLHCSIFGETCLEGQSVYWLRYEPLSGLIYSDGDRKGQCKKFSMNGSTVQKCVHTVLASLASDETYFCSVVTCGKLIIGNGTKLIADAVPQKTMMYIITLLSALLVISLILNIVVMLLWRRATHRGADHVSFTAQTADADSENYASLKFTPHRPTHKIKSRQEASSVVYASVRKQRV